MAEYFPTPNRASVLGRTNQGFASAYPQPKKDPWGDYGTRVLGMVKELLAPQTDVDAMTSLDAETTALLDQGKFGEAAALGATPEMFDVMGRNMMGAGVTVWQGGPAKYGVGGAADSLQHMSKGEGAQAYGWGRYDAEAEAVAREYQEALGSGYRIDGSEYLGSTTKGGGASSPGNYAADALQRFKGDKEKAIKWLSEPDAGPMSNDAADLLKQSKDVEPWDGFIYKHDLPDEDIARYLDWDAPLSEQADDIYGRLDDMMGEDFGQDTLGSVIRENENATILDVFNEWYGHETKQGISEKLGKAGIPGLKYYDVMSRGMTGDYIVRMPDGRRGSSTYATKAEAEAATQMPSMEGSVVEAFDEPRTRNFVTWDQGVLDKMKLLERNGVDMLGVLK